MSENVSFWKRLLALILDIIIVNLIIVYPFRGVFIQYFGNLSLAQSVKISEVPIPSVIYWVILIISILALIYFTFFDYFLGQTPGKMLLKIKSISLKNKDHKLGLSEALLKNCFVLPFFPFYIFWVVEPIYLAFYKERFLEKITFTKTVYESDKIYKKIAEDEYKLSKVK